MTRFSPCTILRISGPLELPFPRRWPGFLLRAYPASANYGPLPRATQSPRGGYPARASAAFPALWRTA